MNPLKKKVTTHNMTAIVDVQWVVEGEHNPSESDIQSWVEATLAYNDTGSGADFNSDAELTIRIVEEEEIAELNQQYRQKQGSTNVLSFSVDEDLPLDIPLLGDLVICPAVVVREANEQNKTLTEHWAHMVIHGTLHLLGYDHIEEDQAKVMEQIEISILQGLGFSNPYEVTTNS